MGIIWVTLTKNEYYLGYTKTKIWVLPVLLWQTIGTIWATLTKYRSYLGYTDKNVYCLCHNDITMGDREYSSYCIWGNSERTVFKVTFPNSMRKCVIFSHIHCMSNPWFINNFAVPGPLQISRYFFLCTYWLCREGSAIFVLQFTG